MLDLLVIGAGLSGLSAAFVAAKAGLRVRVIAKGLGALHWHAGTLDVLGYLPGSQNVVTHPFAAFDALPAGHPYRVLGPNAVHAAISEIVGTLDAAGLAFRGAGSDVEPPHTVEQQPNVLLPTAIGAARPTWYAPTAQLAGQMGGSRTNHRDDEQPMLIVGFVGLRDFYPAVIAEHLAQQGIDARAVWLPCSVITTRDDSTTVHLAQALDDPATVDRLAQAIQPLVGEGARVGLPAILGYRRHVETLAQLRTALDAPVFEIPTLPPSVPGIRIHRALVAALNGVGVRVEAGMEAIRAEFEPVGGGESTGDARRVRFVETATAARPLRHHAHAFLLATGGILGGALHTDVTGRVWEPVFDLPVRVPATRDAWFRPVFLDPQGHPIFSGGVEVDANFQPRSPESGARCFENLWAAGNGLAHSDGIRERSLEGVAIATGSAAAQAIVQAARGSAAANHLE